MFSQACEKITHFFLHFFVWFTPFQNTRRFSSSRSLVHREFRQQDECGRLLQFLLAAVFWCVARLDCRRAAHFVLLSVEEGISLFAENRYLLSKGLGLFFNFF